MIPGISLSYSNQQQSTMRPCKQKGVNQSPDDKKLERIAKILNEWLSLMKVNTDAENIVNGLLLSSQTHQAQSLWLLSITIVIFLLHWVYKVQLTAAGDDCDGWCWKYSQWIDITWRNTWSTNSMLTTAEEAWKALLQLLTLFQKLLQFLTSIEKSLQFLPFRFFSQISLVCLIDFLFLLSEVLFSMNGNFWFSVCFVACCACCCSGSYLL